MLTAFNYLLYQCEVAVLYVSLQHVIHASQPRRDDIGASGRQCVLERKADEHLADVSKTKNKNLECSEELYEQKRVQEHLPLDSCQLRSPGGQKRT